MPIVLRIVGAVFLVALGACILVYLFNRDRRWLRFAWQLFRFGLVIVLIFLALFALERLLILV